MNRFAKQMVPMLSVAVLGAGSLAQAGSTSESAYCYKSTDGSGYCYGNFLGFRNHAGSGTKAYFYKRVDGTRNFNAAITNPSTGLTTNYSCIPDTATSALWSRALAHSGYFYVSWDATGTCTYLSLYNGSQYSTF
jgi:hypothetical protein